MLPDVGAEPRVDCDHFMGSVLPSSVIGSIGEREFGVRFLEYLSGVCGAEHFAAFVFEGGRPSELLTSSLDGTDTPKNNISVYWKTVLFFVETFRLSTGL